MSQPQQPKKIYSWRGGLGTFLEKTGRAGGSLLKELTKSAPKIGNGVQNASTRYGALSSGQIELDKAIRHVRSSNLPSKEKKIMEADLLVRGTQNLTGTRVTKEKVAAVEKELKGLVGESAAAEVQRVLGGLFQGGRERTGVDVEKAIRMHTRNLHGWQKEAAARRLAGLDQKGKPLRKNNVLFNEDIAQAAANLGSRGGKYSTQKFEKPFYPSKNDSPANGAQPEGRPEKRVVGLREGLFGMGRRQDNDTKSDNK
ncbi:MAG TPA: hypothetical protein VJC15_03255 [Candidatus Paceibacterota bacterium]